MTQFIIAAVLVQVPLFFGALLWAGRRWPGGYQTVPPRFLVLRALWISAYCLLYGGLFLLPFGGIGYWQIPISGLPGWLADARVAILFAPLIVYPYALLGGLLAVLTGWRFPPFDAGPCFFLSKQHELVVNLLGLERDVPICDWWPSEFRVSRLDSIAAVGPLIPVAILVAVLMALLQMLWLPIAISALWRHDVPGWWGRFAARSLAMLERPTEFVLLGRWESSRRLVEYTPIDYTDALAWPGDGSSTVAPSVPPA